MVRLYRGQVPKLAAEIIKTLIEGEDIEVEQTRIPEAEKDISAVMDEYLRKDMKILDQAKDLLSERRESRESLGRILREIATAENHLLREEGIDWMQKQIIECLIASPNVEEIFGEDVTLLKRIREAFAKVLITEETLDSEVRARIKNVEEGTPTWDLKYQEVMREVRRKHGLTGRTER